LSPRPQSARGSASSSGVRARSPEPMSAGATGPSTRAAAWTCRPGRHRIRWRPDQPFPRAVRPLARGARSATLSAPYAYGVLSRAFAPLRARLLELLERVAKPGHALAR
jgi:hypothetical protein